LKTYEHSKKNSMFSVKKIVINGLTQIFQMKNLPEGSVSMFKSVRFKHAYPVESQKIHRTKVPKNAAHFLGAEVKPSNLHV
jgi:hypothetical protein